MHAYGALEILLRGRIVGDSIRQQIHLRVVYIPWHPLDQAPR